MPATSTDATTATPPFTHYRYEPVVPPALAGIAPFTPGEATLYLALLDDQVDTPVVNGRWLFPPRVPILMAEEHGMLDGFMLGQPPNPADGPSGDPATFQLLVVAEFLAAQGYPNVKNLAGGILAWADQIDPKVQKY